MLVKLQFKSTRDIYVFEEDQKYFMTPLPSHPKYNLLNGIKSKICSTDSIAGVYISDYASWFKNSINSYTDYTVDETVDGYDLETGKPIKVILDNWDSLFDIDYSRNYGVADNIEQVLERFAEVINIPENNCVICYTTIEKSEQEPEMGWRWHKWGTYIGTQEPQCEHLYDEEDIERVICFHIYQVVPKV